MSIQHPTTPTAPDLPDGVRALAPERFYEPADWELSEPVEFFEESDHPLAHMYRKRVEQNRDLVILVTDKNNDRGTGKTTECLRLAHGMDRTSEGLTREKTTISPDRLLEAYTEHPKGSALVLDESEEGADKYKASSSVNSAIRSLVSMGRVEEKYLVLNAPADHLIDGDLKSLVDVWIIIQRRGVGETYRMKWNPHGGHRLTEGMGAVGWDAIPEHTDLHDVFVDLAEEKTRRLRGDEGGNLIRESEAEERIERARKEARRERRDEIIRNLAELEEIGHKEIGRAVDLSRGRVSQIVAQEK